MMGELSHYTKSILKSLIKLICGTEGGIVVAHGRLPSPASLGPNENRRGSSMELSLFRAIELILQLQ